MSVAASYQDLLHPLLRQLGWTGSQRALQEAMPYNGINDMQDLRDAMAHLGFGSRREKSVDKPPFSKYLPAIGIDSENHPCLLTTPEHLERADRIVSFHAAEANIGATAEQASLYRQMRRFTPVLGQIMGLSLVIGLLTLAPILFNRGIYDHIIAGGSLYGLDMMIVGVVVALGLEISFRHIRNRRQSFFGARIDHYVSCSVMERLLFLPPLYTERASISAQLARLRDFEAVREFFTGPLSGLIFEFPLILIYMVAMILMTGWLALVPAVLLLSYGLLIMSMNHKLKELSRASSQAATQRQEFLLETVTKLRAIRLAGLEHVWQERYRTLSGKASLASFRLSFMAQILETFSYVLMMTGGVATLGLGVVAVITKSISTGALVAAMMLIWRIIAPMQICCASLTRLQQLTSSVRQVQRLLAVAPEHNPYEAAPPPLNLKGKIAFHRVSLRYAAESEPALLGVTLEIKPGQIVAVKGNNGSGKSTLLKLILGLYQPQSGSVRIDGVDIRQFDPVLLRQTIAYIPQHLDLFPGTIRENMRLPYPAATDEEIVEALRRACAYDDLMALPDGLDTMIDGDKAESIPFILSQRINLARAYLKPAPIMLFDEASYSLGSENDKAFTDMITHLRGKSTVVMVTHREDHMRLADQLLIMNKGELTHGGPPDQVLTVLQGRKS